MFDLSVSFDGEINMLALYASIVSTVVAFLEIRKWIFKNRIRIRCTPNMIFVPSHDKRSYIFAKVTNIGDVRTTVDNFLMIYYPSFLDEILKRNGVYAVIKTDNVPKVVEVGEEWQGFLIQDETITKYAQDGRFYVGVSHSMRKNPIYKRVRIKKS